MSIPPSIEGGKLLATKKALLRGYTKTTLSYRTYTLGAIG